MNKVYITKTGSYLPNNPIGNEQMEAFLGLVGGNASRARRIVLMNNGIKTRYYAIDSSGKPSHSNAELTAEAVRTVFTDHFSMDDVEVLSCGTTTPDCLVPSHTSMVHGCLGGHPIEINSSSGVCNSGMNALKYGYLSVKSGNSSNAVCTGSERTSAWLRADKFDAEIASLKELEANPILAFEKDFLRFMLSDGAGAVVLQDKPTGDTNLEILFIDVYSYANELETCMYVGGEKQPDGSVRSWSDYSSDEWAKMSIFSFKQDVKLLNNSILVKGADSFACTLKKHGITTADIDWFLPHLSSCYFEERLYDVMKRGGMEVPRDKWFINLPRVGNVGAASAYLMLDELVRSGLLRRGDNIMLSVPESGRFAYSYVYLRVV